MVSSSEATRYHAGPVGLVTAVFLQILGLLRVDSLLALDSPASIGSIGKCICIRYET